MFSQKSKYNEQLDDIDPFQEDDLQGVPETEKEDNEQKQEELVREKPVERNINKTDLYSILEVSRNSTISEIKEQYYKLALIYHPDSETGNKDKFKMINDAYKILSDKKKRGIYDKQLGSTYNDLKKSFNDEIASCDHSTKERPDLKYLGEDGRFNLEKFIEDTEKQKELTGNFINSKYQGDKCSDVNELLKSRLNEREIVIEPSVDFSHDTNNRDTFNKLFEKHNRTTAIEVVDHVPLTNPFETVHGDALVYNQSNIIVTDKLEENSDIHQLAIKLKNIRETERNEVVDKNELGKKVDEYYTITSASDNSEPLYYN